jgi:transposase
MPQVSTYVGLDVHKKSIVIAFASADLQAKPQGLGSSPNDYARLKAKLQKLGAPESIRICHEAGPTGYGLHRKLKADGFDSQVVAPAKTPKVASNRVKTDKRDARKLAEFLRSGHLTAIRVPTAEEEGLRDLLRTRESVKRASLNIKRKVNSLLLRNERAWPGKSTWTLAHREWIRKQRFTERGTQLGLEHYLELLRLHEQMLAELDQDIGALAKTMQTYDLIRALQACKGIKLLTAATIVAEIGDFRRFPSAGKLMSFLGLTPSEHSSGDRHSRGPITRAGNGRLRRLVVEAAWAYWRSPHRSKLLLARSEGVASKVQELAWQAQKRLHKRLHRLTMCGKPSRKALIAVARELTGYIWAIGQENRLIDAHP